MSGPGKQAIDKKSNQPEAITEPRPSSLDDALLKLLRVVPGDEFAPKEDELRDLELFQAACNYLAVAQIFLTWAPLDPKQQLTKEHVKKRLLGHYGTCPGLSLVFAHVNYLIKQTGEEFMIVTGSSCCSICLGRADLCRSWPWCTWYALQATAPRNYKLTSVVFKGVLSALYLEGSITRFYGQYGMNKAGMDVRTLTEQAERPDFARKRPLSRHSPGLAVFLRTSMRKHLDRSMKAGSSGMHWLLDMALSWTTPT
jgi:hypothetical protein